MSPFPLRLLLLGRFYHIHRKRHEDRTFRTVDSNEDGFGFSQDGFTFLTLFLSLNSVFSFCFILFPFVCIFGMRSHVTQDDLEFWISQLLPPEY